MFWKKSPTENFLDPKIVKLLKKNKGEARLGAEAKELTILGIGFSMKDLGKPNYEEYVESYSKSVDFLLENNVTIDKLFGSTISAYINHPSPQINHPDRACHLAIEFSKFYNECTSDSEVKIAINSGKVVVGNIGSSEMMNHTVIGDHYNLTESVLFEIGKPGYHKIVVTQFTKEFLDDQFPLTAMKPIQFSGDDIPLYELNR